MRRYARMVYAFVTTAIVFGSITTSAAAQPAHVPANALHLPGLHASSTASTAKVGSCTTPVGPNRGTYVGTMTTQVQIVNVYGQAMGTETTQHAVTIIVNDAASTLLNRENNPVNLYIQTTPLVNNSGEVTLATAQPFNSVILQFWDITLNPNGTDNSLIGTLSDNHNAQGAALNLLTVTAEIAPGIVMPYPYAIANGTQMAAVYDEDEIILRALGNTIDMQHPFQIDMQAVATADVQQTYCVYMPVVW